MWIDMKGPETSRNVLFLFAVGIFLMRIVLVIFTTLLYIYCAIFTAPVLTSSGQMFQGMHGELRLS